jgi:hypothetical protein
LGELFARTLSTFVVVALLRVGRHVAQRVALFGDLVLDPVSGERLRCLVPAFGVALAFGSFAERVACPLRMTFGFTSGEFVSQLDVLACDRVDRAGETVALERC